MALDIIRTEAGLLRGIACGNPAFTVFKGVPYARPPLGDLRWKPPLPSLSWEGVMECSAFPPMAVQQIPKVGDFYQKEFFPVNLPMSEDCLYLNIWTPATSGDEKLPVMMWIHGGAYIVGYGHEMEFDGEAFCKRGVILVTINYRLGIFGYFAHPALSKESPMATSGNYGLLDQIRALEWIRDNISAFGGDPDNVTIFGQSAGACAVHALISSPLAAPLFNKAIVQSGRGIGLPEGDSLEDGEAFGAEICKLPASKKGIDELKHMPSNELFELTGMAIAHKIQKEGRFKLWFSPLVDGYVLHKSPAALIAEGGHSNIPYILGTVAGDYKDAPMTDSIFEPEIWAKNHLRLNRPPVYVYRFEHNPPGEDQPGAFHSCELWYIFGTLARCHRPMKAEDYHISLMMTDYWTNFAKQGNPNKNNQPSWPAFTDKNNAVKLIT